MSATLQLIREAAVPYGLNLVAAVPMDRYDARVASNARAKAIAPAARSIAVIGNGGGALWQALRSHAQEHPGWWDRANPLDDFVSEVVERGIAGKLRATGLRLTVVYPVMAEDRSLNFIELAKAAGLGGPSILGVAIHPVYGPWIAFRAAFLLDEDLDEPGEALGFDPCPGCAVRSCIGACPAGAVSYPGGWDIPACLKHRVEAEADCGARCHSRVACVIGPEHRYPDDEMAHHQTRALRAMRPYYDAHIGPGAAK